MIPSNIPGFITDEEGAWLAEAATGETAVEIGSFMGRSTCHIGTQAVRLYCVEPFCGQPVPPPPGEGVDFAVVRRNWHHNVQQMGLEDRVVLIELTSVNAFPALVRSGVRNIGLLFIDGSHYEIDLREDVRYAELLRVGGKVAFHDYSNERFPDVKRVVDEWFTSAGSAYEILSAPDSIGAFVRVQA